MTKSIITKDAGHVFLPASVEDHILLSFVRSEPTLGNKKFSLMKIFNIYSCDCKFVIFCFALLLPKIKFQKQYQFWNLLVLTISKHPPHVQFDQVLAEIMEVKDTWYHSFIFMSFDLLEMKITEIWTICSKNCSVHPQRYQYQRE